MVLRAYSSTHKRDWNTLMKVAQLAMRSTPRKDRGGKSPHEIVIGLLPQGPLQGVLERFDPEKLSPNSYVTELNKYLAQIKEEVADQLAAEYDKRKEQGRKGGR